MFSIVVLLGDEIHAVARQSLLVSWTVIAVPYLPSGAHLRRSGHSAISARARDALLVFRAAWSWWVASSRCFPSTCSWMSCNIEQPIIEPWPYAPYYHLGARTSLSQRRFHGYRQQRHHGYFGRANDFKASSSGTRWAQAKSRPGQVQVDTQTPLPMS